MWDAIDPTDRLQSGLEAVGVRGGAQQVFRFHQCVEIVLRYQDRGSVLGHNLDLAVVEIDPLDEAGKLAASLASSYGQRCLLVV